MLPGAAGGGGGGEWLEVVLQGVRQGKDAVVF